MTWHYSTSTSSAAFETNDSAARRQLSQKYKEPRACAFLSRSEQLLLLLLLPTTQATRSPAFICAHVGNMPSARESTVWSTERHPSTQSLRNCTSQLSAPSASWFQNMWLKYRNPALLCPIIRNLEVLTSLSKHNLVCIYVKQQLTWTLTVPWGSCTCSRVASTSSATTNPDVNLRGLSDSPVGSMIFAVALWSY